MEIAPLAELEKQVINFRQYVEDFLTDQNDINEDNRIQLKLLHESLTALLENDDNSINNAPQ